MKKCGNCISLYGKNSCLKLDHNVHVDSLCGNHRFITDPVNKNENSLDWFVYECYKTMTPECDNTEYLLLGLRSELGEIDGVLKKYIRGDLMDLRARLSSEIGDVMWYLAMLYLHITDGHDEYFIEGLPSDIPSELPVNILETSMLLTRRIPTPITLTEPTVICCFNDLYEFAWKYGISLQNCRTIVIDKLRGRKKEGTIKGDGEGVIR